MNSTPKLLLFLLMMFFSLTHVVAQKSTIDSLKNELRLHKSKDSTRVKTLNELAFSHHRVDVEKATEYIDESFVIAKEIGYKEGVAKSIYLRGVIQMMQSNFDVALKHYDESSKIYASIGVKSGIASCENGKGVVYSFRGDYKNSLIHLNKALEIDTEIGLGKNIPNYLTNMGFIHLKTGEYEKAMTKFRNGLETYKKMDHQQGIANCLSNIATVYQRQGNFPRALEYYNKSLVVSEKLQDSLGISAKLNNIGIIYNEQEQYDKALEYYKKSLVIQSNFKSGRIIAKIKNNMGTIYVRKKEYDKAIRLLNESINISNEINDKSQLPDCYNNLGGIHAILGKYAKAAEYYDKGMEIAIEIERDDGLCNSYLGIAKLNVRQKQYDKALANALLGKSLSIKLGNLATQRDAYELLSGIYEKTGDYRNAYSSHKQYKVYNDSLFNKKNIEKLTQLEYEYLYRAELESASNRENNLTQKVKTTNKDLKDSQRSFLNGVITFLVVTLALAAIIFFLKFRNVKSKNQTILIEQKLLRLQMTPHFMFNALSVLQGMILNKEDTKAVQYLSKFSRLLRITLENSRDKMVPLSQELTAVKNYLELQNIEENQSYNYTVLVDENIEESLFTIPPMLIQPFIENAIEHGFENRKEDRIIDVHLTFMNEQLTCVITDNGVGVNAKKETKNTEKKSLATNITAERLSLISKNYKIKGSIKIEDRQKYGAHGTIVTVVIPYKISLAS